MKKLLALALSFILCATLATTAFAEVKLSGPNQFPIVSEPASFSMLIGAAPHIEDYETNAFTLFQEKKTGVHVDFEVAQAADFNTQLNLILNSSDYPDVINSMDAGVADVQKYGVIEKIFIPLNDFITPEIMPNLCALLTDAQMKQIKQLDGNIYGFPSINECYHCMYATKMFANMEILKELNLPVPTTTDEFKTTCEAFLKKYPNGIALGGSNTWLGNFDLFLLNAFTYSPFYSTNAITKDGKVVNVATTEGYKNGLKYLKELYDAGILYEGSMTQSADQMKALLLDESTPVLFLPAGFQGLVIDNLATPDLYRAFDAIAPLKGPDGTQNVSYERHAGVIPDKFCITDKAENPEMIAKWVDDFYSLEGSTAAGFGPTAGVDYVLYPEGKVGINGKPALVELMVPYSKELQNRDWQDMMPVPNTSETRLGLVSDPDVDLFSPAGFETYLYKISKEKYEPYKDNGNYEDLPVLKYTIDENELLSTITVEVNNAIQENKLAFITGAKDIDAEWDAYVTELNEYGLQTWLDILQAKCDAL